MKIFLDVGAHYGETIIEVLKSKYSFDLIHAFEPSKRCLFKINKIKSSKLKIHNFGLFNSSEIKTLNNPGDLGASIYINSTIYQKERIKLNQASEWFKKNISKRDIIFVKLNCEGSECDIIDDLIDNNQFNKIYNILITFDVRDIPSRRKEEIRIRKKLKRLNMNNYCFSDDVMKGKSHKDRINNWLKLVGGCNKNKNKNMLIYNFKDTMEYYASKTGYVNRLEHRLKRYLLYEYYPIFIKSLLRLFKRKII